MSLPLLLAIACTLEIDFGPPRQTAQWDRECQVMWAVLDAQSLASGTDFEDIVRGYIAGLACEGRRCDSPRAVMIRSMNEAGREPKGWDAHAGDWNKSYRWRWLLRLQAARRFVAARAARADDEMLFPAGTRASCRAARHFGGACARTGACDRVPVCWRLADCGPTREAYWIPSDRCHTAGGTIDARTASARR